MENFRKHNIFGQDGLDGITAHIGRIEAMGDKASKENRQTLKLLKAQVAIMENKGRWEFPELFDLDGNKISAELVVRRFGPCFKLPDGSYLNYTRTPGTLAKKGYQVKMVTRVAWAKLKFGRLVIHPSEINYWDINDSDD